MKHQDGSSGSGFLIDGNRLVTNNHVLSDAANAGTSVAQFNYQLTADGANAPIEEFPSSLRRFEPWRPTTGAS